MLRIAKIIKPWNEAGSLNANINLYGFWNETTFLTKSGDLGMMLKVRGVDFESLDQAGQEFAVKRLEAALKSFGPGFHIYQYLFKTNRPEMPFACYGDPLIGAAIDQRRQFFESKLDSLFEIEIYYAVVMEGARSKTGIMAALKRLPSDPNGAQRVVSINRAARSQGVSRGMSKVQAEATGPLLLRNRSIAEETATFEEMLEIAERFSPRIEALSGPLNSYAQAHSLAVSILIDRTGTETLFGTAEQYARKLKSQLEAASFPCSVAACSNAEASLASPESGTAGRASLGIVGPGRRADFTATCHES
jgi:type IV secretory pathway VirB4 component